MKNFNILILFVTLCIAISSRTYAQCVPAATDYCKDANVLCSLDELNGYTCQNPNYYIQTGCTPLCPGAGATNNTNWWAFVTNGGMLCITLSFTNCSVNGTGVQYGIWGDCDCAESIFCDPSCTGPGTKMQCGTFEACKTYYLFVDGCTGDVCDFTITTVGGGAPTLPPLDDIIGTTMVCQNACSVEYMAMVKSGASLCNPNYQWTLDGFEFDNYTDKIKLDFPNEGNFVLCVTAIIGNPASGSICDQKGPKCLTIKVKKDLILEGIGPDRFICPNSLPYNWNGLLIDSSGEYKVRLKTYCCDIDSVVKFIIKPKSNIGIAYYLGCPNDIYVDSTTGLKVSSCQDPIEIKLTSNSDPNKCDSSYYLYAAFITGTARMQEFCDSGKLILQVMPIDKTCSVKDYSIGGFEYNWYKKTEPLNIIGTDDHINVESIGEYCVEIGILGKLNNLTKKCYYRVCEKYNELDYLPQKVCIFGDLNIIPGSKGEYKLDSIPRDVVIERDWTVEHGNIISANNGKDSSHIEVEWDTTIEKKIICYRYKTACGWSEKCCIDIQIINRVVDIAPKNDFEIVPNPISQSFRIKNNSKLKLKSMELYNLSGSLVYTWKTNKNNEYPVDQCAEGSYYLKIIYEGGGKTMKLIINH